MKLVFEHIDFTTVGHLQSLLESEGIATEIRNLVNSGLAGEIPFTQVFPELWVLNDKEEGRALALIRDYRAAAALPVGPPWRCPTCRETVDGVFAQCWNCGTPAPATIGDV